MGTITFNLNDELGEKIEKYLQTYTNHNTFAETLICFLIEENNSELSKVEQELVKYEEKYNMKTTEFIAKSENGELENTEDFTKWAEYTKTRNILKQKLEILK